MGVKKWPIFVEVNYDRLQITGALTSARRDDGNSLSLQALYPWGPAKRRQVTLRLRHSLIVAQLARLAAFARGKAVGSGAWSALHVMQPQGSFFRLKHNKDCGMLLPT